jgi:hypothetical protein
LQAPGAGSSTSLQRIAAIRNHVWRVPGSQVGCIFGGKICLSPPNELSTSCRLPLPKGALPAYQDMVDALRNSLEHQGRRYSFSRYLHFVWRKIQKTYRIFLHFSYTGFFSIVHGENSGHGAMEKNLVMEENAV